MAEIKRLRCKAVWLSLNSLEKNALKKGIFFDDGQMSEEKKLWRKETALNLMLHKSEIEYVISFAITGIIRVRDHLFLYPTLPQLLRHSYAVEMKSPDNRMEFQTEWKNW